MVQVCSITGLEMCLPTVAGVLWVGPGPDPEGGDNVVPEAGGEEGMEEVPLCPEGLGNLLQPKGEEQGGCLVNV